MPIGQAKTADDVAESIRSLVDRMVEAEFSREIRRRGREAATLLAERGAEVGELASEAWREAEPARRDAAKQMRRASRDAARWSTRTWRDSLRPIVNDIWKRRTVAIGAASAAVPVGRELVDEAAKRMGVRRREERRWGAFFLGLIVGAVVGAVVALLTAPKPGREMRDELAARARDTEWVPIFQQEGVQETNGGGTRPVNAPVTEASVEPVRKPRRGPRRSAEEAAEMVDERIEGASE